MYEQGFSAAASRSAFSPWIDMTFTDVEGRAWHRSHDGVLEEDREA